MEKRPRDHGTNITFLSTIHPAEDERPTAPDQDSTTTTTTPFFEQGDWHGFFATVQAIATTPVETPSASPFLHEYTVDAAEYNAELLRSFDYDLERVINAHPNTTSSYGSELRPIEQCIRVGHRRILTHNKDRLAN